MEISGGVSTGTISRERWIGQGFQSKRPDILIGDLRSDDVGVLLGDLAGCQPGIVVQTFKSRAGSVRAGKADDFDGFPDPVSPFDLLPELIDLLLDSRRSDGLEHGRMSFPDGFELGRDYLYVQQLM